MQRQFLLTACRKDLKCISADDGLVKKAKLEHDGHVVLNIFGNPFNLTTRMKKKAEILNSLFGMRLKDMYSFVQSTF